MPESGASSLQVGVSVHDSLLTGDPAARRSLLARVAAVGLDHVTVGDHVSFHDGTGFDGLITATAALSTNDHLNVLVGVYQLPLRHPLPVARQLASIAQLAPGRLIFGVGAAGEDRAELTNCGIDPTTRGRRLDESIRILRALAPGDPVDHHGEFFTLTAAAVRPAPDPPVPIVIGGSSDAAIRRTAELGDGWLAIFCSPRRFARTRDRIVERAAEIGREAPAWFGLNLWCGLDKDEAVARAELSRRMEALYHLPPEKFQHVTAAGTPERVAEWLAPFVEVGASSVTVVPASTSPEAGVELAAEVRHHLRPAPSGGNQHETAQRHLRQDAERGGGHPHAAVADRAAEHGRVRPAMDADRARPAPEGRQRIGVEAQRQDQRTVRGMRRGQHGEHEGSPDWRRRARLTDRHRPGAQRPAVVGDAELPRGDHDPDEIGTAPGLKLRAIRAAGEDPA